MTSIARLMLEGEGRCHWCGKPVVEWKDKHQKKPADSIRATIDHVYPRNDIRRVQKDQDPRAINTVLSCYTCNNNRGDLPYTVFLLIMRPEWREFVEEIVAC